MKPKILLDIFLTSMLALALIIACGGGGSGGDGPSTTPAGQTGSVAVLVTDAPAGAEKIWITITEVTLIPSEYAGNRKPIVIYSSTKGRTIDLLEYQDDNYYMLKLATDVPAGEYSKIRLGIKDVWIEGGECDSDGIELKLPSGRIDVSPRGTFEVIPGETLQIQLDVDAEKSINLHKAGRSGKCIFRPVVFADIKYDDTPPKICPEILSGRIGTAFTETDEDRNDQVGFHLLLDDKDRGSVEVILDENAVLYDGTFVPQTKWFAVLDNAYKTRAKVRGTLDGSRLAASVVVIGEILNLKGVVSDVQNLGSGSVVVTLDEDQELGPTVEVILDPDTLVLAGCDQPFNPLNIEEGMRVRLFGKYDTENELLNAVAVLVKRQPVEGQLKYMTQEDDGYWVSVLVNDDIEKDYFLPSTASVFVGSAKVNYTAWEQLADKIVKCRDTMNLLNVILKLDPEATDEPTVEVMKINAELLNGTVDQVYESSRQVLLKNGKLIKVVDDSIIQKNSSTSDLDDIDEDDEITAYGLFACPDTVDFFAYIVLASDDDDDYDD
ncbi:MAG TPA: DUF4382 domain-containing protein [Desulfobacterales bacterium]